MSQPPSGSIVALSSLPDATNQVELLIERVGHEASMNCSAETLLSPFSVRFSYPSAPFNRLCVSQNGELVLLDGGAAEKKQCVWRILPKQSSSSSFVFSIMSSQRPKGLCETCSGQRSYVLYVNSIGELATLVLCFDCDSSRVPLSEMRVLTVNPYVRSLKDRHPVADDDADDAQVHAPNRTPLHPWQLRRFCREGYLHVPAVVPKSRVHRCLRHLNAALGTPGAVHAGGAQTTQAVPMGDDYSYGKLDGSFSHCDEVRALLMGSTDSAAELSSSSSSSSASRRQSQSQKKTTTMMMKEKTKKKKTYCLSIAEQLMGEDNVETRSLCAQIAIRFPEAMPPSSSSWSRHCHDDEDHGDDDERAADAHRELEKCLENGMQCNEHHHAHHCDDGDGDGDVVSGLACRWHEKRTTALVQSALRSVSL